MNDLRFEIDLRRSGDWTRPPERRDLTHDHPQRTPT